jgi:hypothetical protein
MLFRNVCKELTLYTSNIPEECRSHLLRGGSLKPHLPDLIALITYCKLYSRSFVDLFNMQFYPGSSQFRLLTKLELFSLLIYSRTRSTSVLLV